MADENEENKEGEGKPKKEKKPKKPGEVGIGFASAVLGGTFALCILMVFIGRMIFLPSEEDAGNKKDKDSTAVAGDDSPKVSDTEEVFPEQFECVVNIAGTEGSRYLKIVIEIAFDPKAKKNKKVKIADVALSAKSRLRNRAIEYLSALTLKEVLDKNAKQNIRRDLLREFNKQLNKGEFSNVYIYDYIIQ